MSPELLSSGAVLSGCGRYRYRLTRQWDTAGPLVTFVMLNPSTADAAVDDRTIGRCRGFAQVLGAAGLVVVNLYALRSTDPAVLWGDVDPVGPSNDDHLAEALRDAEANAGPVIAAWGAGARLNRVQRFLSMPGAGRVTALGATKGGAPRHPLYLPSTARPTPWPEAAT